MFGRFQVPPLNVWWVILALMAVALSEAPLVHAQATAPNVAQTPGPAPRPARAPAAVVSRKPAVAVGNSISLNFKDADIDSVVGAFGHLLDKTFVIDPRVRGKVTLETPKPVSRSQAYQLLQSTLRMQGFAMVETGGSVVKVVPEADAKLQAGPVTGGPAAARGGDQVLTQIFSLQHESASNLVGVLRPLISPNNTITAYPNNNQLVVTDYAANLQRVARIIATLDHPGGSAVQVVPVKYAVASEVALTVVRMIDDSSRAGAGAQVDPGQRVVVMADPRINAVMIRSSSPAKINLAKSLIAQIDQPSATPGNVNVVYLRNAEAVRLAQVLRSVLTGSDTSGGNNPSSASTMGLASNIGQPNQPGGANNPLGGQNTPGAQPLQSSSPSGPVTVSAGGAIIAADSATNSLIITAPEPIYRNLRTVIEKLDARRAQVFIESLIVEVSAERAAELGIQWQFLNPGSGESRIMGGTNLTSRGGGTNIADVAANITAVAGGLNLGLVRGTTTIPGVGEILNLGLLARALETQSNANVLATPNLLTLDNEEARIIIGQNVPFVTGQFTLPGAGAGATNPFQTVERRDVGTTLRVKPQVSEAGTVRMQIFQEVSSVQDRTLSAGLITNRRAIESNVLVDDGQIVVLGGLIEEKIQDANEKVPGLGDLPILGNLFRYDTRKRVKTNLLVFLRPVVIRDAPGAYSVTADRYEYIRQLRTDSRTPAHWALPNLPQDQMNPMPPRPVTAPPAAGAANGGSAREPSRASDGSLMPGLATGGSASQVPAPIHRSSPSMIRTAPNEVMVPLNRAVELAPGQPGEPSSGVADRARPETLTPPVPLNH